MRKIKFRAWDSNAKKLILPNDNCRIHFNEGLPYGILKWDGNILIHEDILMQYTGLKDKNGKEIYEGDIVNADDDVEIVQYEGYGFLPFINQVPCAIDAYSEWEYTTIEIIGNIYENHELLKEE